MLAVVFILAVWVQYLVHQIVSDKFNEFSRSQNDVLGLNVKEFVNVLFKLLVGLSQ